MRKFLIVVCCILVFICLFTVAFQWYFTPAHYSGKSSKEELKRYIANRDEVGREIVEKSIKALSADNAAKYYLMACLELARPAHYHDIWENIDDVLKHGWQGEETDLKKVVDENERTLDLMRIGAQQDFCSFPVADYAFVDVTSICFMDFRTVITLLVDKAILLERAGEFDGAREAFAQLFRFAADLYNSGTIIHACYASSMEALARPATCAYFLKLDDEEVCARFLADLIEIEESRASIPEIFESDRANAVQKFFNNDLAKETLYFGAGSDASRDPSGKKRIGHSFVDTALRASRYLSSIVLLPIMKREYDKTYKIVLEELEKPYPEFDGARLEEMVPESRIKESLLSALVKGVPVFARDKAIRQALIIQVALRLHFLRNGEYPETLDELLALVPEHILIDPFSTKRFIYKKTDDGYLFYSVGPNVIDNGGEQAEYPYLEGDLVFRLPEVDEEC